MKTRKSILLLAFLSMLIACTNEQELMIPSVENAEETSSIRSLEEVIKIATEAAQMRTSKETRAKVSCPIDYNGIQIVKSSLTRSSGDESSDTLLYIVNYAENQGFAVIAANTNIEGLLAVTEKGHYSPEAGSDETGFDIFMNLAKSYAGKECNPDRLVEPRPLVIIDTTYETKSPLIEVIWGQDNWPGHYCPNNISGCVPLALAQIFTYYSYPSSINLTYLGHDISTQQLNWIDMRKHIAYFLVNGNESSLYCTAPDSAHNAIGRLCRQLGHMMNSSYEQEGTGTTLPNVAPCLNTLGYSHSNWSSYTAECTKTPLTNNRLILMSGERDGGGHVWVIDGYILMTRTRTEYVELVDHAGIIPVTTVTTKYYNHINWGWNGCNNGYFLDEVFNINDPYQYDISPYLPYLDDRNYQYDLEVMTVYR